MLISTVKSKIDCAFAKQIYNLYLSNRYGIGACNETDLTKINQLSSLQRTFNHYYENFFPVDVEINTGLCNITYQECNVSKLIEKINLL